MCSFWQLYEKFICRWLHFKDGLINGHHLDQQRGDNDGKDISVGNRRNV